MGINVDIGKKWNIKSDSNQFTLFEKVKNKETGEVYDKPVAYYSSLDHCVKWLINKHIGKSNCTSLQEIMTEISDFREQVDESLSIGIPDYSMDKFKLGEKVERKRVKRKKLKSKL